jgi:hypothetical protein
MFDSRFINVNLLFHLVNKWPYYYVQRYYKRMLVLNVLYSIMSYVYFLHLCMVSFTFLFV